MPKRFLYFLVEKDGRVRQVVNGLVQSLSVKKPLPNAPIGNGGISIAWERNLIKHGNIRNFSLPMGFVRDGATILRNDLYEFGVDRKLDLLIARYTSEIDAVYFRDYYKFFYRGELDFSTANDKQGEGVVNLNIMEGGLQKLVKARETTTYSVELDDEAIEVLMDGLFIAAESKLLIVEQSAINSAFLIGVNIVSTEGTAAGLTLVSTFKDFSAIDINNQAYWGVATQDITGISLTGKLILTHSSPKVDSIELIRYNAIDNTTTTLNIYTGTVGPGPVTVDLDASPFVFDVRNGDRLFLKHNSIFDLTTRGVAESNLKISFTSRYKPTIVKAFLPLKMLQKITEKITTDQSYASSSVLASNFYAVTSGDGLRSLDKAKVKTSLSDFFKAFDTYLMLGTGVQNEKIVMEKRQEFYQSSLVTPSTQLGNLKDMDISPASDLMFSRLKIGHAEQNVDNVNGKYDFNGVYNYVSPVESVSRDLEITSPYKAGPYEIESIRTNLEGKTTTDAQGDNDVFILHVKKDENIFSPQAGTYDGINKFTFTGRAAYFENFNGNAFVLANVAGPIAGKFYASTVKVSGADLIVTVSNPVATVVTPFAAAIVTFPAYRLDRDTSVTSGVPNPATIFNAALSPGKLLLVHEPWIHGLLEAYPMDVLRFTSSNQNDALVSGGFADTQSPLIGNMAAAMISPWYFEFGTQVPVNLTEIMLDNINTDFAGLWDGKTVEGFTIKCALAPDTRQEQTFKLLAVPFIDIKRFKK